MVHEVAARAHKETSRSKFSLGASLLVFALTSVADISHAAAAEKTIVIGSVKQQRRRSSTLGL